MVAITQAVLMAIAFLRNKKSSRTSNYTLAVMLVVFAVVNGCTLTLNVFAPGLQPPIQKMVFVLSNLAFLVGPLLFFYIRSLLDLSRPFGGTDWLHALPMLGAMALSLIFIPGDSFRVWQYPGRIVISSGLLIQSFVYCALSFRELRAHGVPLKSFLPYIDNDRLAWVRFFIGGYIVLWLIQLQLFIGWDVLKHPTWCPYATSQYFVAAFLFFNGMVYIALRKPALFHQQQKYKTSVLKLADKERYRGELLTLMIGEKVYRNSALTLSMLAQKLDIAPCHLSQIINESMKVSFRDFVNRYRIDESKNLLIQQGQFLNILGIACEVGFNSKSAFNSAFKKHTGITPKEYRKQAFTAAAA